MNSVLDHLGERAEIIRLSRALLLGPLVDDEIIPSPPTDTYVTGILWPEGASLDSMEDDQQEGAPANEDGETDAGVPGYRTVRPCSLGITFSADVDATLSVSLAMTARYARVERQASEDRRAGHQWKRVPLNYTHEITPGGPDTWSTNHFLAADRSEVHDPDLCLNVRRRIDGLLQIVTVTLINKTAETDDRYRDERCLFQTGLEVRALNSQGDGADPATSGCTFRCCR